MAVKIGKGDGEDDVMVEINTTPLIDVMLVLLIMLIITIPIQTHAVKLDMPSNAGAPPSEKPAVVDIAIGADGALSWNGAVLPSVEALDEHLRAAAARAPQPEIHLNPDRLAKYGPVARVLAAAQRSGIERIGFVGSDQYTD